MLAPPSPFTRARWQLGTGSAQGTCGELAQGVLPGGRPFHVSCPIDRVTRFELRVRSARRPSVAGLGREYWKTALALERTADLLGLGNLEIHASRISQLDRAKGQASSTADIVAAVRALGDATGTNVSDEAIARVAASVEPTDGVMYPGVSVVDQHSGEQLRVWDWWPAFTIAMFVPPAQRDTGRRGTVVAGASPERYADLVDELDRAVEVRDVAAFARQATRSAELNEAVVSNPLASMLRDRVPTVGGLGVCVGHSGTVCGVLFGGDDAQAAAAAVPELLTHLPARTRGEVVRIAGPVG